MVIAVATEMHGSAGVGCVLFSQTDTIVLCAKMHYNIRIKYF